jgi:phage tail sheath protein FI
MAFQLSAGVNVSEIDLTTVVPSVSSSTGAFAGKFSWGPVNEVVTISDEVRLAQRFGRPTDTNYEYWFSAANFLAYSNNLKVVRAAGTGTTNAFDRATANTVANSLPVQNQTILIKNSTDYELNYSSLTASTSNIANVLTSINNYGSFAAKFAGELGNSIKIVIADGVVADNASANWSSYQSQFTDKPRTSDYVRAAGGANDEMHILVIDSAGKFTGANNTVLEKFAFVSKASDAKNYDGTSNYYKDVLNSRSNYVWWLSHNGLVANTQTTNWGSTAANTSFTNAKANVEIQLSTGADGTIANSNIVNAYNQIASPDSTDISLIVTGPADNTISSAVITIAETRKDCVVFISPLKSNVVDKYGNESTNVLDYRANLTSSSYAVMDSGWKYQYDKYNDTYRWVPLNGDVAGLCARTDLERDPWFSPAGANRGIIKNVIKLAWNPTKAERDNLYTKGVNPVVTFAGEGTMLFGDKTMLSRPSAFDHINVRRLFIVLEKSVARAARSSLFEFNDQFTRAAFVNLVEPYLRDVQGRRGITDFRVVCDETNNTAEVIDRNEFIGDIYIKPARSINYIQLNFVAVRTGVRFEEIVGRF